jgi:phage gp36-like protein
MTMLTVTHLCEEADLERLLSPYGVEAFSDHDQTGAPDTGVVDDCIDQASEELIMYLHERYEESVLATSPLVKRWATTVAAYFLCQRRGNPVPDILATEFQRIMDPETGLAFQVAEGKRQIPGLPSRCDMRPTFSNLKVDRRYPTSKTRVTRVNSSDAPTKLTQDWRQDYPVYDG